MFGTADYQDVSLAEWIGGDRHLLMDQHLQVGTSMLDAIPKQEIVVRQACIE